VYHHQQDATKRRVKLQKVAYLRRYDFKLAFLAKKGKLKCHFIQQAMRTTRADSLRELMKNMLGKIETETTVLEKTSTQ